MSLPCNIFATRANSINTCKSEASAPLHQGRLFRVPWNYGNKNWLVRLTAVKFIALIGLCVSTLFVNLLVYKLLIIYWTGPILCLISYSYLGSVKNNPTSDCRTCSELRFFNLGAFFRVEEGTELPFLTNCVSENVVGIRLRADVVLEAEGGRRRGSLQKVRPLWASLWHHVQGLSLSRARISSSLEKVALDSPDAFQVVPLHTMKPEHKLLLVLGSGVTELMNY